MDQVQPYQVLIPIGLVVALAILSLVFSDRPQLAAAIRRRLFADRDSAIMSRREDVPDPRQNEREQRSDAMEQAGNIGAEHVPELVDALGNIGDDQLLDILARVANEDGDYRFAESRIGRFVGGRLEDRIAQVRAVRGEPTTPDEYLTPIAQRPSKAVYQPPN